jgi:hypothetical protein
MNVEEMRALAAETAAFRRAALAQLAGGSAQRLDYAGARPWEVRMICGQQATGSVRPQEPISGEEGRE